mmetsp:Transcript_8608/g.17648  ORF Transcript_8608/g.17648 Transcript_8608/m.17648 type:complete len:83 (+) Transcript_8608:296-544(+)
MSKASALLEKTKTMRHPMYSKIDDRDYSIIRLFAMIGTRAMGTFSEVLMGGPLPGHAIYGSDAKMMFRILSKEFLTDRNSKH